MRVYTDGACRKQVGGWAWRNEDTNEQASGYQSPTTDQRMELYAALDAIDHHLDDPELVIVSDSAYLVNCFKQKWYLRWYENGWKNSEGKPVANDDLWIAILRLLEENKSVRFEWVKGHSGNVGNDLVDALAVEAIFHAARS